MERDTRFDLGFAGFQAAFAVALSAAPTLEYLGAIMICLSISIPSTMALWSYHRPFTTTERFLNRLAKVFGYLGAMFAFAFFLASFSYIAGLLFLALWIFWMSASFFPEGTLLEPLNSINDKAKE